MLGSLLGRRHPNGSPGPDGSLCDDCRRKGCVPPRQEPRIRSLADLDNHYPWPDLGAQYGSPARTEIRNPLAIAIRALKVVEYHQATGSEYGDDGMVFLGLSQALYTLARHGEWDAVGTLVNALEALIDPLDRANWLAGLDPYREPEVA